MMCRWWGFAAACLLGCVPNNSSEPSVFEVAHTTGDGALLSAWGRSSADVFVVGGQVPSIGADGTALVFHFDGDDWTEVVMPEGTPLLDWVWGDEQTIWVVGNAGAALRSRDGTSWEATSTGVDAPLWGAWGASGSDVWAVGGDAVAGPPVIVHFDGQAWSEVAVPALDRDAKALFKVWGTGPSDVHAVGDAGVVLHFDGQAWTQLGSGTGSDLISLWGSGPDDIVAVGGRSNGVLARYDGAAWQAQMLAAVPGLNGVWVADDGSATVVGDRGTIAEVAPGSNTLDEIVVEEIATQTLHAVVGFPDGARVAVGGTLLASPPWHGVVVQRGAGGD